MSDAAALESPDVNTIASAMSRTLVTIDAANAAIGRLPDDLAPAGARLSSYLDQVADICSDALARRRTATDAYVNGAKSIAELVLHLAPLTAELQGAPGATPAP